MTRQKGHQKMTTDTKPTEEPIDEDTAQAALDQLEQDAIDGKPVTPTQLAEARERITLAGLWRKGKDQRAERERLKAKADAQAAAANEVDALLQDVDAPVREAEAALAIAVARLASAVEARNKTLYAAAETYDRVGFPQADYTRTLPLDVDGLDREHFAWWGHGLELMQVRGAGKDHAPARVETIIQNALVAAFHDHQPALGILFRS